MPNISDNPEFMKYVSYLLFFGGIVAFIGILPIDSYAFYMFLRWVLFICFAVSFWCMLDGLDNRMEILLLAPVGALFFNPFDIVMQEKSTWIFFDLAAGALLIFWGYALKMNIENEQQTLREIEDKFNDIISRLNKIKHSNMPREKKLQHSVLLINESQLDRYRRSDLLDQVKEIYLSK